MLPGRLPHLCQKKRKRAPTPKAKAKAEAGQGRKSKKAKTKLEVDVYDKAKEEKKQLLSCKSSAYHKAYLAAKKEGANEDECKAAGKSVARSNSAIYVWFAFIAIYK